jgi:hypothetical protein
MAASHEVYWALDRWVREALIESMTPSHPICRYVTLGGTVPLHCCDLRRFSGPKALLPRCQCHKGPVRTCAAARRDFSGINTVSAWAPSGVIFWPIGLRLMEVPNISRTQSAGLRANVSDPVGAGFVAGLPRPGGMTTYDPERQVVYDIRNGQLTRTIPWKLCGRFRCVEQSE